MKDKSTDPDYAQLYTILGPTYAAQYYLQRKAKTEDKRYLYYYTHRTTKHQLILDYHGNFYRHINPNQLTQITHEQALQNH